VNGSGPAPRRSRIAAPLAIIAIFVAGWTVMMFLGARLREEISLPHPATVTLPDSGPITIALTGDTSLVPASPTAGTSSDEAVSLVRRAALGITNFEPTGDVAQDDNETATRLRALGFDAVSLANNHAMDGGTERLDGLARSLSAAGIAHAGAARDLDAARAAITIGRGHRSVAFIAVTTSAAPEAIATASHGDIRGRAGVSALRYTADITADEATFRTLADSVSSLNAGPPPGERELTMFGTRIVKGDRTAVRFVVNPSDRAAILDVVRAAHAASEIVILSIHSHEPSNPSDEPADFVRDFAHDAIDAGVQLVVGHGPHRVRGFERHGDGAIFYSLGHFSYDVTHGRLDTADPFDAGDDLYRRVLRTPATPKSPAAQLDDERWWEGLAVLATFEGGRMARLEVAPLDLGLERPFKERGVPGVAMGERGRAILSRFATLSGLGAAPLKFAPSGRLELPISQKR
jgi:poly-gamma-glutamate capsule biosynthesis protein CapA/YwtB (metallophosphatase superfamily)